MTFVDKHPTPCETGATSDHLLQRLTSLKLHSFKMENLLAVSVREMLSGWLMAASALAFWGRVFLRRCATLRRRLASAGAARPCAYLIRIST